MANRWPLWQLLLRRCGLLCSIDASKLQVTETGDESQWYRAQLDRRLAPGWYMLEVAGHSSVMGHSLAVSRGALAQSVRIGARESTKRVVYIEAADDEQAISLSIAVDQSLLHHLRISLYRLSAAFAKSRMLKKLSYAASIQDDFSDDTVDKVFASYHRFMQGRIAGDDYPNWYQAYKLRMANRLNTVAREQDFTLSVVVQNPSTNILNKLRLALAALPEQRRSCTRIYQFSDHRLSDLTVEFADLGVAGSQKELHQSDYLCLLGPDVMPVELSLLAFCSAIDGNRQADLFYADHDTVSVSRNAVSRDQHCLKPAWNPELLLSGNYVGQCLVISNKLQQSIGAINFALYDSAAYDVLLRSISYLNETSVCRIADVLYSYSNKRHGACTWLSTGQHDRPLLEQYIQTRQSSVTMRPGLIDGVPRLSWQLPDPVPSVEIIIPSRDQVSLLRACINSILEISDYPSYTITVVDNDSSEPVTAAYYRELEQNPSVKIIAAPGEFNYSALNNTAVAQSHSDIVVLLNNDTEVISSDWLSELVVQASRPDIGCVGAKLFYATGQIQHAGVIVGMFGMAGHAHRFSDREDDGYCGRLKLPHNVSAVTAACLAVRRSIYLEVNGLDEVNLKVAYNDVDFCLRVKEAGYQNLWTPYVELYHHESLSRGSEDSRKKMRRFRSEFDYMQKRWSIQHFEDSAYNPNLALDNENFLLTG